ncbi:unnamed protein product [Calypogeia fissa]
MHCAKLCRGCNAASASGGCVSRHGHQGWWWQGRGHEGSEFFLPVASKLPPRGLNRVCRIYPAESASTRSSSGPAGIGGLGARGCYISSKSWQWGNFSTRKMPSHTLTSSPSSNFVLKAVAALKTEPHDRNGPTGAGGLDQAFGGYQLPPKEILDIVDAPPTPALSFSPKRDKILFLERRSLPPLADLARPELKLAGLRIDASYNTRSRMSFYTGITICKLKDDGTLGPDFVVYGLPSEPKINYVSWSPDGAYLAFTVRGEEQEGEVVTGLGLWVANVETGQARELIGPPVYTLNPIFDTFSWLDESTLVVLVIPPTRGPPPKKPLVPFGPNIQSNEAKEVIQVRTYQDLLKDKHDEDLFDYYATSQLMKVTLEGKTEFIGKQAVYTSIDPSPDGEYLLVSNTHRPYSFIVPSGRFPRRTQLWKRNGELVREICDLPLAENIPITFNSVRIGRRSLNWRADKPSSLYWVETQDGGDAKVEVSPRDIVYTQSANAPHGEEPTVLFKLDLRYGGVVWGDENLAMVYESWYKTRKTRTWAISPGNLQAAGRLIFDRSTEDVYSDPGSPMLRRTSLGTYVLALTKGAGGKKWLLLNGSGATPEGNIPFLDLFHLETGDKKRIWQSAKEQYFETVVALMSDQKDADLCLDELKILVSKESQTDPPQYYLRMWPDEKVSQITYFPHPYPQLADLKKEIIRYMRSDGVQLTANLYLPPGYDPAKEGPLPTLLWAYPREFKNKDHSGQMRGSQNSFAGISSTSAKLWLARRVVILDGPTMPIIGEGEEEANDRYVEQLVSSAQAAVDEVVRRGVSDPKRIAVGGHSYGAFMTANLLAHAPRLFCCGIARAGAYNRTLTPFGFQAEERTLWEAPKTYIDMSPFMLANKIKKPILLIHGEEDNNPGTLTMQSDRFFTALKGHGALTRLVLLPFESHGYQGRESVLHCLWEMDRWLQKYCIDVVDEPTPVANDLQGSAVKGAGSDPVACGSRDGGTEFEGPDGGESPWPWPETLSLL